MVVVVVMLIFGGRAKYLGGVGDVVINHLCKYNNPFGFCSVLGTYRYLAKVGGNMWPPCKWLL
jgi:hypothetical protein